MNLVTKPLERARNQDRHTLLFPKKDSLITNQSEKMVFVIQTYNPDNNNYIEAIKTITTFKLTLKNDIKISTPSFWLNILVYLCGSLQPLPT